MGIAIYAVVNLVVGIRLLALAARTRELPEVFLGTTYAVGAGLGWALILAAEIASASDPSTREGLTAAGVLLSNIGCFFQAVFTWYVFRRGALWAKCLLFLTAVFLMISYIYNTMMLGVTFPGPSEPMQWFGIVARALPFAWASLEAFGYHRKMRLQASLGLGDPVVCNRLWLFGSAGLATFLLAASAAVVYVFIPDDPAAYNQVMLPVSLVCGVSASIAYWLAFLPPKWYLSRIASARMTVEPEHG